MEVQASMGAAGEQRKGEDAEPSGVYCRKHRYKDNTGPAAKRQAINQAFKDHRGEIHGRRAAEEPGRQRADAAKVWRKNDFKRKLTKTTFFQSELVPSFLGLEQWDLVRFTPDTLNL